MSQVINQTAMIVMAVLLVMSLVTHITESAPNSRNKYRLKLSRKLTQSSTGKFRGSSCATDKSRRLCSVNPISWVSGLAECCPGYKCVVIMQTVPGFTISRVRPQCRPA